MMCTPQERGPIGTTCAICHGLPGQDRTAIGKGEFPTPPELFKGSGLTGDPVGVTYWKVANGSRVNYPSDAPSAVAVGGTVLQVGAGNSYQEPPETPPFPNDLETPPCAAHTRLTAESLRAPQRRAAAPNAV
jgi:hypothetical protein